MAERADDNTMICRCEDLTLGDIRKAIADGYRSLNEIKRVTRAGMGNCQGRTCSIMIAQEISWYHRIPMEEIEIPTFRQPLKPVKMGSIAEGGDCCE
jgi:NAD(P)H-nitrite reductase large subunit